MSNLDAREALKRIVKERGESLSALSTMLGRSRSYLQQFVERGSPKALDPRERDLLAQYLDIEEEVLGGPPGTDPQRSGAVRVPRLGVQASAGQGRVVDGEVAIGGRWFDRAWLRKICRGKPSELSIITVSGDSMAPTLVDGDEVLVDPSDATQGLRDGIYVLRRDDALMVKRIALTPSAGGITIISDNPAYPSWRDCAPGSVDVLARVVWFARELR